MWANWLLLRRRDRVVAVGEAVRQALVQNEGFPGERVRVIYNGIDLCPYRNGLANRLAVREELGIGPEELLIFQVARLDYLKDHATAVRTIQRLAQRCPRIRLALIGEGPEMDKIRELVAQHRVQNHICFLGRREDVARLLQAGDLFLLTSISEGIPLTLIEAMAAGLPVVSTAVGGVGEVIAEGKTGLLAPSGDDRALAENILRLADDSSLRRDMGRRGRERANLFFSEDHMHEQYSCLYKEMLGG
jgi:glycosyltransferase involved in cell wall biosynthesis